ncbi:MAG TPA: LysR family transcriptional regulator [Solirubrobacteraceae bacterium]|nr:LysR family transcriptional regulator [Solirubrobacteraceae bacterium]
MSEVERLALLDLNLLVALDALLAEESVTRAGERLSLSQPAMSAALKRLRAQFGDQLLVRCGQRMIVTEFARGLREPLRKALQQLAATISTRPAFDPVTDQRHFRLYANDYVTTVLLAPLVHRLATRAPGVSLETVTAAQRPDVHLVETYLESEQLDLVIAAGELAGVSRFMSSRLFEDRFACVAGEAAPKLGRKLTRAQLATLPYVTFRQGAATSFADDELARVGLAPRVVLTVESFVLVAHVLRHSNMITMLQRRLAAALALDGLQMVQPPVALPRIQERMFWHPRFAGDPAHAWLRGQLLDVAGALTAG